MKNVNRSLSLLFAFGLVLFGCQPDNVDPSGTSAGNKKVAGAFDHQHMMLDSICNRTDSLYFKSTTGGFYIDKCIGAGGTVVACSGPQQKWGSLVMYNGHESSTGSPIEWLELDFTLSTGWMCEYTDWGFLPINSVVVAPNADAPSPNNDWSAAAVSPARNQWKISIPVDSLSARQFDMACRMNVLRLRINGSPNIPTRTVLWAMNNRWNDQNCQFASNSEFATRYNAGSCLPQQCPPAIISTSCQTVYTGITCPGNTLNTATLAADSTGAGANATYTWSNGATSKNVNVTPSATTAYNVTVSNGTCGVRVITHTVNVVDASCMVTINTTSQVNQPVSFGAYAAGQRITNQLSSQGVSSVNASGGLGQAWIFDSANPTGGDTDLGSPNQAFGGPGIGTGGTTTNNTALGKLIVIQESASAPNDNATGGTLNFNFASARKVTSIKLVDIENTGGFIRLARSSGAAVTIPIPVTGNNGVVTLTMNTDNVTQLRVRLLGSGAVAGFTTVATVVTGTTQVAGVRVCDVPPGKPSGAATYCVEYDDLYMYIDGVCGNSKSGKPGSYLGACGSNPCISN